MMRTTHAQTDQLGFDGLLVEAETENEDRIFRRQTAHLPGTMFVALPFFARLIDDHHAAMMTADVDETMRLREEAHRLAQKLNGGDGGILADDNAPGCVLARETAADPGTVPLWGQQGAFIVEAAGCRVRIEIDGVFGIGAAFGYWLGFSAHAIDRDEPFISPTGYRRFLGLSGTPAPGITPDEFARRIIERHVAKQMGGKLVAIEPICGRARVPAE